MNTKNFRTFTRAAVMAGILGGMAPAMADEAVALLNQMRTAVHTLDYTGTLVYVQGNELSTYQISHVVENGAERESIIRLTQQGMGGDGETVESFSLAKFQQVQPQMEQVYAFDLGGEERVANHVCRIVVARPRDRMRYLQRYCIDPASGMLLKYSLVDQTHKPVEQILFTALDITAPGTQAVSKTAPVSELSRQEPLVSAPPAAIAGAKNWAFENLPAGFRQVNQVQQLDTEGKPAVQQLILSDGMSSVSVFIADAENAALLDSMEYSSGGMNIFTARVARHTVILVGEVPAGTLKKISEGLRYHPGKGEGSG